MGTGGFSVGPRGRGMAPSSRMRGAIPLLPCCLFVACYREDFTGHDFVGTSESHIMGR